MSPPACALPTTSFPPHPSYPSPISWHPFEAAHTVTPIPTLAPHWLHPAPALAAPAPAVIEHRVTPPPPPPNHLFTRTTHVHRRAPADNLKPSGIQLGESMGFGLPVWLLWVLSIAGIAAIAYLMKQLLEFQKQPNNGRGKPKQRRE